MSGKLFSKRGLVAAVALATIASVVWFATNGSTTGEAHGVQVNAIPAPDEHLAESPTSISVAFSEPIEQSVTSVQLWDTSPAEIPLGTAQFPEDDVILAEVPNELPSGIYTVIWRNLSTVDGHTWAGSYSFIVLGPNGEVPAGDVPTELQTLAQAPSNTPSTLDTVARWIVLLGSAVMLGGVAYVAFVVLPATRVTAEETRSSLVKLSTSILVVTSTIAALLVFQGSLIQLLSQADELGGLGKTDDLLLDTRFGQYLIARQALLLVTLGAIGLVWFGAKGRWLGPALGVLLVSSFGVLFTQSMVSHAAGADGAFWKISADLLHLVSASLWVGALIHIGLSMPRWLDELRGVPRTLFAAESFKRFSVLAAFSVLVIMVSGVLSALAQFTSFEQLWNTSYGWSLIAKIAVILPLLAVGGLNAFIFQPRIIAAGTQLRGAAVNDNETKTAQSTDQLHRLLVNTVRIEAVIAIAVLVTVGVLTQLEPARAEAEAEAAVEEAANAAPSDLLDPNVDEADEDGLTTSGQAGGLVISLQIDPGKVGMNNFELGLGSEFGSVGEVLLVRLDFEHETVPQSSLELPLTGSARFASEGTNLSQPGEYDVTTVIRRRGEEDVLTNFTIQVDEAGTSADDGGPGEGEASGVQRDESSIWDWPFEDRRSSGAIVALAVGAVGLAVVAFWQARNLRRS